MLNLVGTAPARPTVLHPSWGIGTHPCSFMKIKKNKTAMSSGGNFGIHHLTTFLRLF